MTSTDPEGRYEFKDLPAGRYNVSASKGSYVQLAYGQQRPFEPGKPLQILDGQTVDKVDFTLPRGGIVTGRIADEFGNPISDVQVSAMRYQFLQGRRQLVPAGRFAQTNDIGEYRMPGWRPGGTTSPATLRNFAMMGTTDNRSGYSPTYYPGTGSVGEAQRITVAVGQALSNVNMSLVVARTARVSGVVLDADGKPANGGMVMLLQRTGGFGMFTTGGQIKPDGTFVASNVAPGEYTLQANVGGGFGDMPESATAKVTVTGDDIEGVRLAAQRPAVATGLVVLNSATPNTSVRGAGLRVNAMPSNPEEMMFGPGGGGGNGAVKDDLTFELRVRPCVCVIRSMGPPNGWYVKAVRLNGVDVTDSGIEFRSEQELSGIEVEMTNAPSDLSGVVTDRGKPSHDYTVVIFARDRERWIANSRYLSTGRPDQDGKYKIRGLPAGDYYAIALEYVEQGEWSDPEFLERVRQSATGVSINDGETKTLDLKLVSGT